MRNMHLWAALGVILLAATAAARAAAPKISQTPTGAVVETDRYKVEIQSAVVVSFFNKLTGEEYLSARADLAKLLPHLPSGLGTQAGRDCLSAAGRLFRMPWWEHPIDAYWPNQHFPTGDSKFSFAGKDGQAELTYQGLSDGRKTYDDETYTLAVQVDKDTGDLLLTASAQSPRKGVYGCVVTVAPLAGDVTIEAPIFDGVRLDRHMRPMLWVNLWASFWDYAFVALNGKDTGAVGVWCQDAELKYYKQLFYLINDQGLSFSLSSMNVPPFDELTAARGVTWRFQAFDKSWTQAAARFRQWRARNVKTAKRPDWTKQVCFMNNGVNAGKMWLDCLAAYFENKHLERTVTFAPVIRRQPFDRNHADNMYYAGFPQEMKAWKAGGAKLMAYLQPMIMWTPDAKTDREKDAVKFHALAVPRGAFRGRGGDHHLGEPHWQRWFLDWVREYIQAGADGVYHDQSYNCSIDSRGLAVNGMTTPQGMADYFYKAQTENPDTIHGTEHLIEVNVIGASVGIGSGVHWGTGAGQAGTINTYRIEHASPVSNALHSPLGATFGFPHMSEISHGKSLALHHGMNLMEMRGDMPGNYLQNVSLYNGKTVPYDKFRNELWLDRKRATTFVWLGLRQVFPDDFPRDMYSGYQGAAGEEFRYEKAPWGSRFVQVQGDKKTLVYGRIHGVAEADIAQGAVAGWCMYGPRGIAGLNPQRFYIVDPDLARPATHFAPGKSAGGYYVEDGVVAEKFAYVKLSPLARSGPANATVVLVSRKKPLAVVVNGKPAAVRAVRGEGKGPDGYEIDTPLPAVVVAIFDQPANLESLKDFTAVRTVLADWHQDLFDSAWLTATATWRKDRAGKIAMTREVKVRPGRKQVQMHFVVQARADGAKAMKIAFTGRLTGAEVNGMRREFSAEKGKPAIVTVPLSAGQSALVSLLSDAGGTCRFEWASREEPKVPMASP